MKKCDPEHEIWNSPITKSLTFYTREKLYLFDNNNNVRRVFEIKLWEQYQFPIKVLSQLTLIERTLFDILIYSCLQKNIGKWYISKKVNVFFRDPYFDGLPPYLPLLSRNLLYLWSRGGMKCIVLSNLCHKCITITIFYPTAKSTLASLSKH